MDLNDPGGCFLFFFFFFFFIFLFFYFYEGIPGNFMNHQPVEALEYLEFAVENLRSEYSNIPTHSS